MKQLLKTTLTVVAVMTGAMATAPAANAACKAYISIHAPNYDFGNSSDWLKVWSQKEGKKKWVKVADTGFHDGYTYGCWVLGGIKPTVCRYSLDFRKKSTKVKFKVQGTLNGKTKTFYSDAYRTCEGTHYVEVPSEAAYQ